MKLPIYLDNQATTQMDPRVLEAMMPYLTSHFGNPASSHIFGLIAREAVENARAQVAGIINADPGEIIFTSGATESNNLAIKGAADALRDKGNHIVTVNTEHKAVLDCMTRLESQGFHVTYLPVGKDGLIDPDALRAAITPQTILVSVMTANNEIGVIQPVSEIGAICRKHGIWFHSDAAQAVGKIPVDVVSMQTNLLSISAHKIYGPKGVGALYVQRRDPRIGILPQMDGGGHERGLRSGTLNAAGIVGPVAACEIAAAEMPEEAQRIAALRDRLRRAIQSRLDHTILNGSTERWLPGNLNLSFEGIEGEALLVGLSDIAVSSSSACTSSARQPSYVLKALGVSDELAYASVRFGIGRFNTPEEIDWAADKVVDVVRRLRELSGAAGK